MESAFNYRVKNKTLLVQKQFTKKKQTLNFMSSYKIFKFQMEINFKMKYKSFILTNRAFFNVTKDFYISLIIYTFIDINFISKSI